MKRRDFLLASAGGLVIPWWGVIPEAQAQAAGPYSGRILINIHASGGIDQSSWTDPRENDPTLNHYAGVTPANVSGNIRSAPMGTNNSNKAFFDSYYRQTLVLNGVDSETNSHEDGARVHATGRLDLNYPNLSELFAGTLGSNLPMPWLNAGGYAIPAGLVAPTPMPSLGSLQALVSPNAQSANVNYMKQTDLDKVMAARAARLNAIQANPTTLPRAQTVAQQYLAAFDSRSMLTRVAQYLPAQLDSAADAHMGLIAAQAGITSTIQLSRGGFDAHSSIVPAYTSALPQLTSLIDYIWQKSAALGLSNRIFIRVYSEFGRTPLNAGDGKDHLSVGSQVLMEANPSWGNRVFGASGPRHETLKINTATGAVDPINGVVMTPRHIHAVLRNYLGIQTTDPRFDLKVPSNEMFDFLNPSTSTGYPST
jgi:hypothetical protein